MINTNLTGDWRQAKKEAWIWLRNRCPTHKNSSFRSRKAARAAQRRSTRISITLLLFPVNPILLIYILENKHAISVITFRFLGGVVERGGGLPRPWVTAVACDLTVSALYCPFVYLDNSLQTWGNATLKEQSALRTGTFSLFQDKALHWVFNTEVHL